MNLLNPGVDRVIIYNGSETLTLEGNDISPESTLNRRIQTRTGSRGGYLPFLVEHTLELKIADTGLYEAIQGQRFNLVIEKFNGYYVWGVNERLIKEESIQFDPESVEYPLTIKAKNISESPEIGQDGNLLGEFADLDGDNVADGWGTTGGTTVSFSNGEQTAEVNIKKTLDFAYPGELYRYSVNVVSLHANADNVIRWKFKDSGSTVATSDDTITTTGIKTGSVTAPAGSDSVEFEVRANNITVGGSFTIATPKLYLD